jgi:hypothetical protein
MNRKPSEPSWVKPARAEIFRVINILIYGAIGFAYQYQRSLVDILVSAGILNMLFWPVRNQPLPSESSLSEQLTRILAENEQLRTENKLLREKNAPGD